MINNSNIYIKRERERREGRRKKKKKKKKKNQKKRGLKVLCEEYINLTH